MSKEFPETTTERVKTRGPRTSTQKADDAGFTLHASSTGYANDRRSEVLLETEHELESFTMQTNASCDVMAVKQSLAWFCQSGLAVNAARDSSDVRRRFSSEICSLSHAIYIAHKIN
jgi:hypothetical protein